MNVQYKSAIMLLYILSKIPCLKEITRIDFSVSLAFYAINCATFGTWLFTMIRERVHNNT